MPKHMTEIPAEHSPSNELIEVIDVDLNFDWGSNTYYGDGSGGMHTQHKALRRCGVGLSVVDDNFFLFM